MTLLNRSLILLGDIFECAVFNLKDHINEGEITILADRHNDSALTLLDEVVHEAVEEYLLRHVLVDRSEYIVEEIQLRVVVVQCATERDTSTLTAAQIPAVESHNYR